MSPFIIVLLITFGIVFTLLSIYLIIKQPCCIKIPTRSIYIPEPIHEPIPEHIPEHIEYLVNIPLSPSNEELSNINLTSPPPYDDSSNAYNINSPSSSPPPYKESGSLYDLSPSAPPEPFNND